MGLSFGVCPEDVVTAALIDSYCRLRSAGDYLGSWQVGPNCIGDLRSVSVLIRSESAVNMLSNNLDLRFVLRGFGSRY
jgi:hypothetical protein